MYLPIEPKKFKVYEEVIKTKEIREIISDFDNNIYSLVNEFLSIDPRNKSGMLLKLQKDESVPNNEGYKINITNNEIVVKAKTSPGAFYAITMLEKIFKNKEVNLLEIDDSPDLPIRGVMIDISRSKVPKLETLKKMIKMFAELRYNHLELYVEGFSFEYQHFKELLIDKNYITLENYLELEKYANRYYIDFVPNQNGFGHMTDWLMIDKYKHLAECENGFNIWGSHRLPSTLNPLDNESFELVKKMYADMIPYTSSKYFNMNFDEPYELGHGKSKEIADETSVEDLYINYFNKLADVVRSYGKTPMLWGDVLINNPNKINCLPKDAIFIDWGYNKDYQFDEHAKMLEKNQIKYMLAPGTSSWSCITGRQIDMRMTIKNSISAAINHQGLGVLITDWGDCGHLQYLPISYHGFVLGGLLSWNAKTSDQVVEKYLKDVFNDDNLLEVIFKLSNYHLLEGEYRSYGSRLFSAIIWAEHSQNQENPVSFFKEKMQYNLLDNQAVNDLKQLFDYCEILLKSSKKNIETDEVKNSLRLLKTLLQINQLLKMNSENEKINFETEIHELNAYLKEHLRLWFIRNIKFGYPKSANRIYWLIEMLRKIDRKENI